MQPIVILINFILGGYVLVSVHKYMQTPCQIKKPWSLNFRENSGSVQTCNGIALPLHKIKLEMLEYPWESERTAENCKTRSFII
jgi:hypothetical protein